MDDLPLVQQPFVKTELNGQVPEGSQELRVVLRGCSRALMLQVATVLLLNQDVGKVWWRRQGRRHHGATGRHFPKN